MDEAELESRGWRRWFFAAVLVAVGALAVLPFWADARSRGRVPSDEELAAAVAVVRDQFEDGDAVWVEPSWWLLPRHALEHMGAGTEAWPFPALLVTEDADPVEMLGYTRIFVLAGFSREPALPPELGSLGVTGEVQYAGEDVAVARYDLGPTPILRRLTREWQDLSVARRFGPEERLTRCPFRRDKHRCGRDSWMDVALEPRVVWRRETRWLFVHPGPPGTTLEVAWKGLEREHDGASTWLYVRAGPTLEAVRHKEGKAVDVAVLVDGVEVDRFQLEPRRFWMERRAIALPQSGGDARGAEVVFRITSDDNAWRETVLEADLLATLPDSLRAWATQVIE